VFIERSRHVRKSRERQGVTVNDHSGKAGSQIPGDRCRFREMLPRGPEGRFIDKQAFIQPPTGARNRQTRLDQVL